MSSAPTKETYDTSIKAWLKAMEKAKKIESGGRLVFVNKRTGVRSGGD